MGKKVFKKITKLTRSRIFDPLGINKGGLLTPVESALAGEASPLDTFTGAAATRAAEASARQQAEIQRQQAIIQSNATQLAANSVADNTANVVAGGTAAQDMGDAVDLKKRRAQTVSSVLGV